MGKLRQSLWGCAIAGALAMGPAFAEGGATPTGKTETYDLLFRNGTLDAIHQPLRYSRAVENAAKPESGARETGEIDIAFEDKADRPREAVMTFRRDGKHRSLGVFPASVGNPIIMYFVETVVRDMAETAGGSPFYIRNRVKESLIQPAEIADVTIRQDGQEIAAKEVTLRPFAEDPNRDQMQGFGDLALVVTMSEKVPGWYHSLAARIEDPSDPDEAYSSVMTLEGMGAATGESGEAVQ